MNSLLARTRCLILLVWCFDSSAALLARPVSVEPSADDAVVAPSKSAEATAGSKTGLSFPSALPSEIPFRGDAELFSSATRATGSVVLLVGLILMGSFLLKRYWPGRFSAVPGERYIEVLETVGLGERQSLTLVRIGHSRLLLARTTASITLLERTELTPATVAEATIEAPIEREERNRNELAAAITVTAGVVRRFEARFRTLLARLNVGRRPLRPKPRSPKALKTPSFEQIMQAQLGATASSSARPGSAGRSRLSEIRNRLQAE
jgi:flagellar biogenesis protein FliO